MRVTALKPQYVELMPKVIDHGVLYISQKYATAVHKCCCGCGEKVVTPLRPMEWSLSINNDAVTLRPSIGNWSFTCRSHYWIRGNRVVWAGNMSQFEIERNRRRDAAAKREYFSQTNAKIEQVCPHPLERRVSFLERLLAWFTSR